MQRVSGAVIFVGRVARTQERARLHVGSKCAFMPWLECSAATEMYRYDGHNHRGLAVANLLSCVTVAWLDDARASVCE